MRLRNKCSVRMAVSDGITGFEPVRGTDVWYWGTDCTGGDLYEAEELYQDLKRSRDSEAGAAGEASQAGPLISATRLVFMRRYDGHVIEPVPPRDGVYFGEPVCEDGKLALLLADFPAGELKILSVDGDTGKTEVVASIPRGDIEDCYNLRLHTSPLTLSRQQGDSFQLVWPEKAEFAIDSRESFCFRDGDLLYFSQWFEDPDYREETVVRRLDGTAAGRFPGSPDSMPDGNNWLILPDEEARKKAEAAAVAGNEEAAAGTKESVVAGGEAAADPTAIAGAKAEAEPGADLAWRELSMEHLVKDRWVDFRRSTFQFPDGSVHGPFYSYSRKDYVVIVAMDEAGKLICVRQFRQGIREVTTEFPAGGIENTTGKEYRGRDEEAGAEGGEDALSAAKRELKEETGYVSDDWRYLLTVPSNATIADNYAHVYAALNCRRAGGQHLDETEFLNVVKHSPEELERLIHGGKFQQAVHVMAWYLFLGRGLPQP